MQIRCIDRCEDLLPYQSAWNRLAQQSPTNTVFQTFEWLISWWEALRASSQLRVVLGFDKGNLVAAAPLVVTQRRRYGQTLVCVEFAGGMPSDYLDFLYQHERDAVQLIAALCTDMRWDLLHLDRIPVSSPTLSLLQQAFPGWRGTQFVCDFCPAYVFSSEHDGSDILKKKSLRRHENGLKKVGTVAVRHSMCAEEIEPQLEDFFAQHVGRRTLTDTPSLFLDARYKQFYRLLTRRLTLAGRVVFTTLSLDEHPVAFHYGFVSGQRFFWYMPAFSPQHERLSPGEVLLACLFRFCRDNHMQELDFTVGDEAFKSRFSNVKRYNMRFEAFRSRSLQQLDYVQRRLWEKAKRFGLVRLLHAEWIKRRESSGADQLRSNALSHSDLRLGDSESRR
ncbi:MAG: GNAT family N-acetyltransferase [Candidatus Binatia bacterium]